MNTINNYKKPALTRVQNVSEMTYFVSGGMQNLNSINQSINHKNAKTHAGNVFVTRDLDV